MATGPINYLAGVPQTDFLRDIQSGLQLGSNIAEIRNQRLERDRAVAAAQQYNTDVAAAIGNPTPQAFSSLALKYPQQREAIKQAWDGLDEGERKSQGQAMAQSYSALLAGKPEIAKDVIQRRIDALENSGMDATSEKNILGILDTEPRQAQAALGFILSHTTDPEKFAENFGKIGAEQRAQSEAPAELRRKEALAGTAESEQTIKATEARYIPQKVALELEQKGWDIKKLQEDIRASKEGTRLRAMEVALSKETNDLRRTELQTKIDEAKEKQAEKVRDKVATAESGAATIDNMLSTIERVALNPSLNDVLGSIEGRIPSVISDEGADAIALIDTLGSQAFLAQIPAIKGLGQLSDAEGKKLQSSLTNLSRTQSESQFKANLKETTRLLNKARQNLSKSSGVPLPKPDTPSNREAEQRNIVVDF